MPPCDRYVWKKVKLYQEAGLVADKGNGSLVAEVKTGSRAEKAGFQKGDIITKIEYGYRTESSAGYKKESIIITEKKRIEKVEYKYSFSKDKYRSVYNNREKLVDYIDHGEIAILSHTATITVLRGKQKIQLTLSPRYANFSRYYWLHESNLEKVRK